MMAALKLLVFSLYLSLFYKLQLTLVPRGFELHRSTYMQIFFFFKDFIYLFMRDRERETEAEGEADSPWSREPDAGLDPGTRGS